VTTTMFKTATRLWPFIFVLAGLGFAQETGQRAAPQPAQADESQPAKPVMVIERILPFAEADRVHVEVTVRNLNGKGKSRLGLTGIISDPESRDILWEGPVDVVALQDDRPGVARRTIANLKPRLWSLSEQPSYAVTIIGTWKDISSVRKTVPFAFRSFEVRKGQFHLNGKPIFLRGLALNPPLSGMAAGVADDLEFARAYVRQLKKLNVNCIRTRGDVWLRACDEEGMLAITGCFGPPPGSTTTDDGVVPPEDVGATIDAYKRRYFMRDAFHPSVVMHVLSQKMPNRGEQGRAFHKLLAPVYRELRRWDPSRLIVSNAGVGDDRLGDLIDRHVYSGWYEGSFADYMGLAQESLKPMPVLLSECVGAATGAGGRFSVSGADLGPSLAWGGHAERPAESALAYQSFLARQAIETLRYLRTRNRRLGGIMPMTPLFRHWRGVSRLEDMQPAAVASTIATAYSPVMLSFETWTRNLYAGDTLRAAARIVNDSDDFARVCSNHLTYAVVDGTGRTVIGEEVPVPDVPYYAVHSRAVRLKLPPRMPTGRYLFVGRVTSASNVVAETAHEIFVADRRWTMPPRPPRHIAALYDPAGKTAKALKSLNVPSLPLTDVASLEAGRSLVIGAGAWDGTLAAQQEVLGEKVREGCRVLMLLQSPEAYKSDWLPVSLDVQLALRQKWSPGMWVNLERPEHRVFDGITRGNMQMWSDPRGWNTTMVGYPHVFPSWMALRLSDRSDLGKVAVLGNVGIGLADTCLCELFSGEGSVVVSSLDCVGRAHMDPVAARMLMNLVQYTADPKGHECLPRVEEPIYWGDYASERGLITGPRHGFVVNAGFEDVEKADAAEGFASRQSVPHGRRAIGPFTYDKKCLVVPENPDAGGGDAVFHAAIIEGCAAMVTTVENPSGTNRAFSVELNGTADGPHAVAAGATVDVRTPIPHGTQEVAVRYTAPESLVFLKTAFE
jgi:beta-galactosidase